MAGGIKRHGRQLNMYFQFYAAGEHRAEIVYADGTKQSAAFAVPDRAVAELRVELDASVPSGYVFRQTDPRFGQILAACLKNTLAGLRTRRIASHNRRRTEAMTFRALTSTIFCRC